MKNSEKFTCVFFFFFFCTIAWKGEIYLVGRVEVSHFDHFKSNFELGLFLTAVNFLFSVGIAE